MRKIMISAAVAAAALSLAACKAHNDGPDAAASTDAAVPDMPSDAPMSPASGIPGAMGGGADTGTMAGAGNAAVPNGNGMNNGDTNAGGAAGGGISGGGAGAGANGAGAGAGGGAAGGGGAGGGGQ